MKTKSTQQEIILMANTTFAQTQFCEKDTPESNKNFNRTEQLENACWNGLLQELLPGVIEKSSEGKKLYLWQIRHGAFFLQIELCEHPQIIDENFSIDPQYFLQTVSLN